MTERLLITTAMEETWGNGEPVYFLGEWCKLYHRKEIWIKLDAKTQSHHWNDRIKLKKDHDYLKDLYERTLVGLSKFLNRFHNLDKPVSYWRIILGPWLFTYIPVLFDRWEVVRIASEQFKKIKTVRIVSSDNDLIPFDYNSFSLEFDPKDLWNHLIFIRILTNFYNAKTEFIDLEMPIAQSLGPLVYTTPKQNLKNKIARLADKTAFFLSGKNQKIMFLNSYFPKARLFLLNLKLKFIPRLYIDTFFCEKPTIKISYETRKEKLSLLSESQFEEFLFQSILKDIPIVHLEAFPNFLSKAKTIKENPSIVLTTTSHWTEEVFKIWIAERIPEKSRLILADHGSTFPALFDFFDHDESICEKKVTWFKKTHPKHTCLPPTKIKLVNIKSENRFCSIIGLDYHRYASRVTAFAHVEQSLVCLENTVQFCKALDLKVFLNTKIRPKPDSYNLGWDTKKRYEDALGKDRIFEEQSYYTVLKKSKLIVCTYADTTFSEALATGIPSILVYRPEFFEKIPEAQELIQRMEKAKLIFTDPIKAATHVNAVWDHLDEWWKSNQVRDARQFFFENALHIHYDWYKEWTTFLKNELYDK